MKKYNILLLLLCFIPALSQAQPDYLQKIDLNLKDSFASLYAHPFDKTNDSLRPELKKRMLKALKDKNSFNFSFDSLTLYMRVIKSHDKKLRIFSWDQMSGGNWHDMASIAQFQSDSGKVFVQDLVLNDEEGNIYFTDAINYEIHEIKTVTEKYYLVFGFGTHGSGHHHKIAQLLSIENDSLVRCKNCFDNKDVLIQEIPRSYKIKLEYDISAQTITFDEFKDEEDIGFAKPTGKTIILKFINGKFVKQ